MAAASLSIVRKMDLFEPALSFAFEDPKAKESAARAPRSEEVLSEGTTTDTYPDGHQIVYHHICFGAPDTETFQMIPPRLTAEGGRMCLTHFHWEIEALRKKVMEAPLEQARWLMLLNKISKTVKECVRDLNTLSADPKLTTDQRRILTAEQLKDNQLLFDLRKLAEGILSS